MMTTMVIGEQVKCNDGEERISHKEEKREWWKSSQFSRFLFSCILYYHVCWNKDVRWNGTKEAISYRWGGLYLDICAAAHCWWGRSAYLAGVGL